MTIQLYPLDLAGQTAAFAVPAPKNVAFVNGAFEVRTGDDYTEPEVDRTPVTRRQMLTALHRTGLLPIIKSAVAASDDVELQIAFDESQEFQRGNAFLAAMATALGKTDAEVDGIFALARTL